MEQVPHGALRRGWPSSEASRVRVSLAGDEGFALEAHPDAGFLMTSPFFGEFKVSRGGDRVAVTPAGVDDWIWQRMLVGQILPLASVLQGFEVLHCSAVEVGGKAVLFAGGSGTGKTSLALHLVNSGWRFMSDDVIAVSEIAGEVSAEPGPPLASIDRFELDRVRRGSVLSRVELLGAYGDEVRIYLPVVGGPRQVEAMIFLRHVPGTAGLRLRQVPSPELGRILAASFNWFVRTQERLARQLDVAAAIATNVGVWELSIPQAADAGQVAQHVLAKLPPHIAGAPAG